MDCGNLFSHSNKFVVEQRFKMSQNNGRNALKNSSQARLQFVKCTSVMKAQGYVDI